MKCIYKFIIIKVNNKNFLKVQFIFASFLLAINILFNLKILLYIFKIISPYYSLLRNMI